MADTATAKKQDIRKPNIQPNVMPAELTVTVKFGADVMGELGIPQGAKLSEAGNITYFGGIAKNWKLPGDSSTALAALSFTANGVDLVRATAGVHANRAGNPCVFHSTVLALSTSDGEVRPYAVQIIPTYRADKGFYELSVLARPAGGGGGPIVRGSISGDFDIAGFEVG